MPLSSWRWRFGTGKDLSASQRARTCGSWLTREGEDKIADEHSRSHSDRGVALRGSKMAEARQQHEPGCVFTESRLCIHDFLLESFEMSYFNRIPAPHALDS